MREFFVRFRSYFIYAAFFSLVSFFADSLGNRPNLEARPASASQQSIIDVKTAK